MTPDPNVIDTVRLFALIGLLGCALALMDIRNIWLDEYWRDRNGR